MIRFVCFVLLTLSLPALARADAAESRGLNGSYVVVIEKGVLSRPGWGEVVAAVEKKYGAAVLEYGSDPAEAVLELALRHPRYVAFVIPPEKLGLDRIVGLHRMMRELDDDPYTDALWSVLTGYEPADALRMVNAEGPMIITRGASGMGSGGSLGPFEDGFCANEGKQFAFYTKKDGEVTEHEKKPDCIAALVEGMNEEKPQFFITSGHATTEDWTAGYNFKGGQFRHRDGQLYGLSVDGSEYDIHSPNPKVYLAAGNCLIGDIPKRDCMATAWMHTGGANQMVGYTVVTWFGEMGWGVRDYFLGQPGRFDFVESWFFSNQALLRRLETEYPRFMALGVGDFDKDRLNQTFGFMAERYQMISVDNGKPQLQRDALGLLWDRDTVALYGDPAWEARLPEPKDGLPWKTEVTTSGDETTVTVTATRDGGWPGRPIAEWLPVPMRKTEVLAGAEHKPVITDNFVLLPLSGEFKAGERIEIRFRGEPCATAPDEKIATLRSLIESVAEATRDPLRRSLARAGANRESLIEVLEAFEPGQPRDAAAFLIAHMPPADARTLDAPLLKTNTALALKAWNESPWKEQIPFDLFCNDVLPYASLNETREDWRTGLHERFAKRAAEQKTLGDAAVWLNKTVFPEVDVQYHATNRPKPCQSPAKSMEVKFASCTGLSILLVDACRACGIPARIAGIPVWKVPNTDAQGNHGGNHNWVEVWDGERWRFLGAAEDTPLDQAWFVAKANEASDPAVWRHTIYASSWKPGEATYPLVWSMWDDSVPAVKVTERYRK